MKVEMLKSVWEGKLSCQTILSFSDVVDIDNGVAICGVLSDDELINAALGKDEVSESNVRNCRCDQLSGRRRQRSQQWRTSVFPKILTACPIWSI